MADLPRDPRQLARDILAGKVRIEDLARERQRVGGALPAQRPPQKIPLPRPAPPPMPPAQQMPRPQQRPIPQQRPQQRPAQRPAQQRPMPAQRPMQIPPQQRPQLTIAPPQENVTHSLVAASEPATVVKAPRRVTPIRELVQSRTALRQGILLTEVLGKPVALRDEQ